MRTGNSLIVLGLAASAAWLTGCGDDADVRSYDVPKDQHAETESQGPPPHSNAPIDWDIPEGWRKLPGTRPMRVATFEADGPIQIAVSVLPGDAGGILANVNRWRGQLGLGPIARNDMDKHVESLAIEGSEAYLVDLTESATTAEGDQRRRIIVAVVPLDEATWFVKAVGHSPVIEPQKDAIASFARSFRVPPPD